MIFARPYFNLTMKFLKIILRFLKKHLPETMWLSNLFQNQVKNKSVQAFMFHYTKRLGVVELLIKGWSLLQIPLPISEVAARSWLKEKFESETEWHYWISCGMRQWIWNSQNVIFVTIINNGANVLRCGTNIIHSVKWEYFN